MQCRTVLTRIDALRTRELPAIEQTAVESHLKTCRSCNASRHDVDELVHVVKTLTIAPPRSCRDACSDSYEQIGDMYVAFTDDRIRMITYDSLDELRARYAKRFGRVLAEGTMPATLRKQVTAALRGDGVSEPKVDLEAANDLEHDVLQMLTRIPRGQV